MLKRVLEWDGVDLGVTSDLRGLLPAEADYSRSGSLAVTARPGMAPQIDSVSLNVLDIPLVVALAPDASMTTGVFSETVRALFPVGKRATLRGVAWDGITVVDIDCVVSRAGQRSRRWVFDIVLTTDAAAAVGPSATSGTGPTSISNTGSQPIAPIINLTTSTHVTYRSTTVTGAGSGGGLIAYPLRISTGNVLSGANKVYVFVSGVSVPIRVIDGGSDYVYVLVDTASDGTTATQLDIYYGSNLPDNPLVNTLQEGGADMTGPFSDTSWSWDSFGSVLSNPARCGSWRAAQFGNHSPASNSTYRVTVSGTTAICEIGAQGQFDNSADSIVLVVGSQAGNSNALANLSRITANLDGTNAQAFIRYRTAGSSTWQQAWSTRSNAGVTTAVDLDAAVEIAVGIENDGATNDPATLTIDINGITNTTLAIANNPSVSLATAANADYYNGTYQIGDYILTLTNVICPDGTLTIDCGARTISSSASGPIYGEFSFSDPDEWALLQPGANTITDGLSATDTITYRTAHG